AGTIGFLESLPASRWQIWQSKVVAGALLVAVQAGVILGLGVGLDLLGSPGTVVRVARDSVTAFAWGLLGSTLARTTLGSVGIAVPSAVGVAALVAVVVLLPLTLLTPMAGTNLPPAEAWVIFRALMNAVPVALSAWVFTRP